MGTLEPRPGPPRRLALEGAIGACIVVLIAWLSGASWRFYTVYLLPEARAIPTATVRPVVSADAAREEARRFRQVLDHIGAGIAFRQANQREKAIQEFQTALSLDPQNVDARVNLAEIGALPAGAAVPPAAAMPSVVPSVTPRF
ncbi:MAG: tetratricopeptide repeat protein [Chloroflexota bacterium]|nr:tetratricopeptide repeat protein [Chloroflexota bacterium]